MSNPISRMMARGIAKGMPYRRFGKTEWMVSAIGLGCAPFGDLYGTFPHSEKRKVVQFALESGINIIDTSPFYGETASETNVGLCLRELSGDHPRNGYYLCTKMGRYSGDHFDFSGKMVEESIQHSMERLQTDYLDLVSIHDFEFAGYYPDDKKVKCMGSSNHKNIME